MIRVAIPWPPKECHPNARPHRMAKHRAAKKYRTDAANCTLAAGIRRGDPDLPQAVKATIIFSPPSRRGDIDNMLASIKSGIDGVVDILGIDDSRWQIAIRRTDPVKHGLVTIEIEEAA